MRCLIFLSLLFGVSTLFAQDSISRTEVPDLLRALHDTLVCHHPATQTEAERIPLRQTLEQLLAEVPVVPGGDSVHIADFISHAAAFQELLGDGHLELNPVFPKTTINALRERQRRIAVYKTVDEGFIVLNSVPTISGDTLVRGDRIRALDGIPVETIMERVSSFSGLNDNGRNTGSLRMAGYNLSNAYLRFYGIRDSTLLTLQDDNGRLSDVWVRLKYQHPRQPEKKKKKRPKPENFMKSEILPADSIWHLAVRSFSRRTHEAANVNYYRELRQRFALMVANPGKGLIIDLRDNTGGSILRANELMEYLSPVEYQRTSAAESRSPDARPQRFFTRVGSYVLQGRRNRNGVQTLNYLVKPNQPYKARRRYAGNLVVIVNETTFSAAAIAAHGIRKATGAPVVGTSSGGSVNRMYGGDFTSYPIGKDGRFRLQVANFMIRLWQPGIGNLEVDHYVPRTRDDVMNWDYDATVDKAIELLLEQHKQQGAAAGAE